MMAANPRRSIDFVVVAVLGIALVLRVFLTMDRRFNMDEFEHVHAAWMLHNGASLYRDFWQNHTPLLYYVLTPLFWLFADGVPLLFVARGILSASALLILWLTYRIARTHLEVQTSLISVAVLSFAVLFIQKTIEIRPDQFLVSCWLASVLIMLRSMQSNGKTSVLLAGITLGLGMLFSPKALLCYSAMIVAFFLRWLWIHQSERFLNTLRRSVLFTLGFIAPFVVCALLFFRLRILRLFLDSTLLNNFTYPHGRAPLYLFSVQHLAFLILSFAGIAIWLRDSENRKSLLTQLVLVPCISLFFIFAFLLPTSSPQSALLFVPLLAIFGGYAVRKSFRNPLLLASASFCAVLIPLVSVLIDQPSTASNSDQLALIRAVVNRTSPRDVFFDGSCSYVFRRQAFYYGSLPDGLLHAIRTERIRVNIPESLIGNQCKFVVDDGRLERLPEDTQVFIRQNYLRSQIAGLMIAGKELNPETFSATTVRFQIEVPQKYEIQVKNSGAFFVDGSRYTLPVFLMEGEHEIVSNNNLEYVLIRAPL